MFGKIMRHDRSNRRIIKSHRTLPKISGEFLSKLVNRDPVMHAPNKAKPNRAVPFRMSPGGTIQGTKSRYQIAHLHRLPVYILQSGNQDPRVTISNGARLGIKRINLRRPSLVINQNGRIILPGSGHIDSSHFLQGHLIQPAQTQHT